MTASQRKARDSTHKKQLTFTWTWVLFFGFWNWRWGPGWFPDLQQPPGNAQAPLQLPLPIGAGVQGALQLRYQPVSAVCG